MFSIAICDDNEEICRSLKTTLTELMNDMRQKTAIDTYLTGEELYDCLEEKFYDLIYLDIEFPAMDGIETGRRIREILKNESTDIVYISGNTEYAAELFANHPYDFLVKPLECEKIWKVTRKVMEKREKYKDFYQFETGKRYHSIQYKNIMYFESDLRYILLVTKDQGTYKFKGKLSEIEKQVPATIFVRTHKSYLVNWKYVEKYKVEYLTLKDSQKRIDVSKKYRNQIQDGLINRYREAFECM